MPGGQYERSSGFQTQRVSFFFYSNEGDPREPLNIHVRRGSAVAKLWLEPIPGIAESYGLAAYELRELMDVAIDHTEEIERYWNENFGC